MKKKFEKKTILLLTGATGAFGRFLALDFLKHDSVSLILPVRATSDEEAKARVSEIITIGGDRVEVYKSDILEEHLGLPQQIYEELIGKTTHILHSAASTRFNLPLDQARIHNVETTKQILGFAKKCPNLIRFGFLSTALVAGKRSGLIKEDEFEHQQGFNNSYQQSKYEAEALVRDNQKILPTVIIRPSMIISSEVNPNPKKVNFLSILVSLVARGFLPCVPGTERNTMDIVNGNDAARITTDLMLKEQLSYSTYQITNGDQAIDVKTFHQMIEKKIGRTIPIEYCGSIDSFSQKLGEIIKSRPELASIYQKAESFLLEPAYPKIFDNQHTLSEFGLSQLGEPSLETLGLMFKNQAWNLSE